jgi:hypothetical protein
VTETSPDEPGGGQTSAATEGDVSNGAATNGGAGRLSKDETVRVMPFGDSITATGCWREEFLLKVNDGGYQVDMVGSTKEKQCNETDVDNEGHSGKLITQEKGNVTGWASANPADVVLFHWGTNDVWKSAPISDDYVNEILAAYTTSVEGLRGANPNVIVVVAQIIPLNPTDGGCAACPGNVQKLNAAIPAWATGLSTAMSPVLVADFWTGFDVTVDTQDGAHPYTATGVEHMASRWYEAFEALF